MSDLNYTNVMFSRSLSASQTPSAGSPTDMGVSHRSEPIWSPRGPATRVQKPTEASSPSTERVSFSYPEAGLRGSLRTNNIASTSKSSGVVVYSPKGIRSRPKRSLFSRDSSSSSLVDSLDTSRRSEPTQRTSAAEVESPPLRSAKKMRPEGYNRELPRDRRSRRSLSSDSGSVLELRASESLRRNSPRNSVITMTIGSTSDEESPRRPSATTGVALVAGNRVQGQYSSDRSPKALVVRRGRGRPPKPISAKLNLKLKSKSTRGRGRPKRSAELEPVTPLGPSDASPRFAGTNNKYHKNVSTVSRSLRSSELSGGGKRLIMCDGRVRPESPADGNFIVEKILEYQVQNREDMFKIRWEGYTYEEDSFEPLTGLWENKDPEFRSRFTKFLKPLGKSIRLNARGKPSVYKLGSTGRRPATSSTKRQMPRWKLNALRGETASSATRTFSDGNSINRATRSSQIVSRSPSQEGLPAGRITHSKLHGELTCSSVSSRRNSSASCQPIQNPSTRILRSRAVAESVTTITARSRSLSQDESESDSEALQDAKQAEIHSQYRGRRASKLSSKTSLTSIRASLAPSSAIAQTDEDSSDQEVGKKPTGEFQTRASVDASTSLNATGDRDDDGDTEMFHSMKADFPVGEKQRRDSDVNSLVGQIVGLNVGEENMDTGIESEVGDAAVRASADQELQGASQESNSETVSFYQVMSHLDVDAAKKGQSSPLTKWLYHVVLRKTHSMPGESETFTYQQGVELFPAALEKYLVRISDQLRDQVDALVRDQEAEDAEAESVKCNIDLLCKICKNPVGFGIIQNMFIKNRGEADWNDPALTSILQKIVDESGI